VGARVRRTTVGAETPIKVLPNDNKRAFEKSDELSPDTTDAAKSVGDARPVSANDTTMSKETAQE